MSTLPLNERLRLSKFKIKRWCKKCRELDMASIRKHYKGCPEEE